MFFDQSLSHELASFTLTSSSIEELTILKKMLRELLKLVYHLKLEENILF